MVVALLLPELFAMPSQNLVGSMCRESLQGPEPRFGRDLRRNQHVDVIRHHNIGMQIVTGGSGSPEVDCGNKDSRNFGFGKESRPGTAFVEEPVHQGECPARFACASNRKESSFRQAAVQSERNEEWSVDDVPMGKVAFVVLHREDSADSVSFFSEGFGYGGLKGRSSQEWLPYTGFQPGITEMPYRKGSSTWVS